MAKDGRRWTTDDQEAWLTAKLPDYLEAALTRRFDKFWPILFQMWFDTFEEPPPDPDDPTDCESDTESDDAPPSDNDNPPLNTKKRKRRQRRRNTKKAAKVCYISSPRTSSLVHYPAEKPRGA